MILNRRIRTRLTKLLPPGAKVEAAVALQTDLPTGSPHRPGLTRSCLSLPYCRSRGLEFDDPRFRTELANTILTVTNRRVLFHKVKQSSILPAPGDRVADEPLESVSLGWYDGDELPANRLLHLTFADGRDLVQITPRRGGTFVAKPLAEPDLLVEAFGARAIQIED